jgi:hypothetical protein
MYKKKMEKKNALVILKTKQERRRQMKEIASKEDEHATLAHLAPTPP